jgi:hypothetical protein
MNPAAIHIIEANLHLFDTDCWIALSANPAAIHILKANQTKISWPHLSANPAIFEPNLPRPPVYKEDLVKNVFRPDRVERMGGPEWLECV